jgi:hypothetical protein
MKEENPFVLNGTNEKEKGIVVVKSEIINLEEREYKK